MDRSYRAPDRVHVYESAAAQQRGDKPLKVVSLVAYAHKGLDNYKVDGTMFKGYINHEKQEVRVFLDRPYFGKDGFPT